MKLFFVSLLAATALVAVAITLTGRGINYSTAATIVDNSPVESFPANGKRTPVVVELFTSEGCSSCPPADAALAQLESAQPVAGAGIIALSEHVDYWNYIGWTDPFSSAAFSARQESYANVFGNERIYTPQMVVDGQAEFVGSNAAKAREAIVRAARAEKATISLTQLDAAGKAGGPIKLAARIEQVPAINDRDIAEVLFAITESNLFSNVSRGENSGRKLSHVAVVRELRMLGRIDDASKTFTGETSVTIAEAWKRENLRAVVFVQERTHRRILGAAVASLSAQ